MYLCVCLGLFAVQQKLAHYKSTIINKKIKRKTMGSSTLLARDHVFKPQSEFIYLVFSFEVSTCIIRKLLG